MQRGAFGMFDALGMRGIWKGVPPDRVVAKFETLSDTFRNFIQTHYRGEQPRAIPAQAKMIESLRFAFLSDTVVVGVVFKPWPGDDDEEKARFQGSLDAYAIVTVARVSAELARIGAEIEPGWAYRGCISFGQFAIDRSSTFFVGDAVDDAAEHMNSAQGAFCWLTPEACSIVAKQIDPSRIESVTRYPVPIKGAGNLDTFVASPFGERPPAEAEALVPKILATFKGSKLDVEIKRQNTEVFLRRHLAEYRAAWERAEAELGRLNASSHRKGSGA